MQTRPQLDRSAVLLLCAALAGALVAGCGTTQTAVPVKIGPDGQVDINHSHWKVIASEAGFDGRAMEIRRTVSGNYVGTLTDRGHLLNTTFGAIVGTPMMELIPKGGVNKYAGYFTPFAGQPLETTFSVSADGQELKCGLQSFRWVRQPD
jgi:hypothetical protein